MQAQPPPPTANARKMVMWILAIMLLSMLSLYRLRCYYQAQAEWTAYLAYDSRSYTINNAAADKLNRYSANFITATTAPQRLTFDQFASEFDGKRNFRAVNVNGNTAEFLYVDPDTGGRAAFALLPQSEVGRAEPDSFHPSFTNSQFQQVPMAFAFATNITAAVLLVAAYKKMSVTETSITRSERIALARRAMGISVCVVYPPGCSRRISRAGIHLTRVGSSAGKSSLLVEVSCS